MGEAFTPRRPHAHTPTLFLLLLAALPACQRAPEPGDASSSFSVSVSISTNIVHIGDLIELNVTALHPRDGEVRMPAIDRGKELVVRNERVNRVPLDDERARSAFSYTLASYRVGEHRLFTNAFLCVLNDGTSLYAEAPDLALKVETTLAGNDTTLRPLKALAFWPRRIPPWLWVVLLVSVLALLAGLLVRRFLAKPRTILHHPPPLPAHEIALRSLRALRNKGWIEHGEIELFYVELSRIVRVYLESRLALHAPEQTTEEFIREAATSHALSAAHQQLTRAFLEQSDLVKFARHRPAASDMEAAFAAAERLVIETQPKLEEAA